MQSESRGTVDAMYSTLRQLFADERRGLTTEFNVLLRQFLQGLQRVVPSKRAQLELADEILRTKPADSDDVILGFVAFLGDDPAAMLRRIEAQDRTLLADGARVPNNPIPYAELEAAWDQMKPASRANVWQFLLELSKRAYTLATQTIPIEEMDADLALAQECVGPFEAQWAAEHAGAVPPADVLVRHVLERIRERRAERDAGVLPTARDE